MKIRRGTYVDNNNHANIKVGVTVTFDDENESNIVSVIDDDGNDWTDGMMREMNAASIYLH